MVFERGDLVFDSIWPGWVTPLFVVAAVALAVGSYARRGGDLAKRDRVLLSGLRFVTLAALLFCLARPVLVVATVVPQENFLGILLDDSRSMELVDGDRPRRAVVDELFGAESPVLGALADRFKLRYFRFAETVERAGGVEELRYRGRGTDLARALDAARRELAPVPLAGLVVVTDGADNRDTPLPDALLALQDDGVPVHVVGVGRERFDKDLELTRVEAPRRALAGSSVAAEVTLAHSGLRGQTMSLQVEDGGRIVGRREVRLPADGEALTVRVPFTVSGSGPRRFRFAVAPVPGELVSENNALEALIEIDDRQEHILYFEGEPRFEVKFLRRAVADDDNIHVVTLQRTAENKFLRLDVSDSTQLAAGFPRTREELFRYRGLILGSVEASFFTLDQLRMIADFVAQRGGGLLALGGRRSFAEGGFAETALDDVLPVELAATRDRDTTGFFAEVKVQLTPAGRVHPVIRLAEDPEQSETRWAELPPLSSVNPITEIKPGASLLLSGRSEDVSEPLVVLAHQRYGRGRSIAFAVQDSWLWQMHADIPLDDLTHETLWQQLLRWMVSGVPDPISVTTSVDRAEPGSPVEVTAEVLDSGYLALNGAEVVATAVAPSGQVREFPLEWVVERDGEYRGSFTPAELGLHEVHVEARRGGTVLGAATSHVEAADLGAEYFGAQMRAPLLRRIAEETGGRFYTPESASTLPEDVSFTESGATVREERGLWNMPVLFLLVVGLVAAEWGYRRRRGLP